MAVSNEKEFQEWLAGQSREVCAAIAFRAAMRTFSIDDRMKAETPEIDVRLQIFRTILTASVAVAKPSGESLYLAAVLGEKAEEGNLVFASATALSLAGSLAQIISSDDFLDATRTTLIEAASMEVLSDRAVGPTLSIYAPQCAWPDSQVQPSDLMSARIEFSGEELESVIERNFPSSVLSRREFPWTFWAEWYDQAMAGDPLPWDLQEQIALIPDEIWEAGPEAVALRIEKIREEYDQSNGPQEYTANLPISREFASNVANKIIANREPIAILASNTLEQIAEHREHVRGYNRMSVDERDAILGCLDKIASGLSELLELTPDDTGDAGPDLGERGAKWLYEFRKSLAVDAKKYVTPENIAGATIPTTIILACTGIGTLVGMPVPGAVVGGLLTGQLKPGKAVEELLRPSRGNASEDSD